METNQHYFWIESDIVNMSYMALQECNGGIQDTLRDITNISIPSRVLSNYEGNIQPAPPQLLPSRGYNAMTVYQGSPLRSSFSSRRRGKENVRTI